MSNSPSPALHQLTLPGDAPHCVDSPLKLTLSPATQTMRRGTYCHARNTRAPLSVTLPNDFRLPTCLRIRINLITTEMTLTHRLTCIEHLDRRKSGGGTGIVRVSQYSFVVGGDVPAQPPPANIPTEFALILRDGQNRVLDASFDLPSVSRLVEIMAHSPSLGWAGVPAAMTRTIVHVGITFDQDTTALWAILITMPPGMQQCPERDGVKRNGAERDDICS